MSTPAPLDPRLWHASAAPRRFLAATVACGVVISGCAVASAIVLARIVSRVITVPGARGLSQYAATLAVLAILWMVRSATHWLQARLAQRGASAVIADLSEQVLSAVTSRQPRQLTAQRDAAATVV